MLEGVQDHPGAAALKREVARPERARPLGEDEELAPLLQQVAAPGQGLEVRLPIALVLSPDDFDPREEQLSKEALSQLRGDHERGPGEDGCVDESVHGAVPVEAQVDHGTGGGEPVAMEDRQAVVVKPPQQAAKEAVPGRHDASSSMGRDPSRAPRVRW